jgi:adenine-specific DNA methylase
LQFKQNLYQPSFSVIDTFDYKTIFEAQKKVQEMVVNSPKGLKPVPDEPLPWKHGHRAIGSPRVYGMRHWGDLFTDRQKLGMIIMAKEAQSLQDGPVKEIIALQIGKAGDGNNSLSRWMASSENPVNLFSRQALPMVWDFCESTPISQARGVFLSGINYVVVVIESAINLMLGQVEQADACNSSLPDQSCDVWFTDPPYYDAIPYADISDFFFVWLKRTLNGHRFLDDSLDRENPLTPKRKELTVTTVANEKEKPKNHVFFEKGMAAAFLEGRRVLKKNGVGCIVFAHKTTEGWEALLAGIIKGGWTIMSSWPVATESSSRLNARDTASLATSVHLVCRPRPEDAPVGDWSNVIKELPARVGSWMERLQGEGVRGADLVFACIGPALEIYSRYSKVVDAEDREIPLGGNPMAVEPHKRGYLAYVWEAVGKAALEQVLGKAEAEARKSASGALEEDARLTALFLWTLQSTNGESPSPQPSPKGRGSIDTVESEEVIREEDEDEEDLAPKRKKGGFSLVFDVVRRFALPLGIILPDWEGRIIETEKGIVRLLSVKERAKQLFGDTGAQVVADELEKSSAKDMQLRLFPVEAEGTVPKIKGRGGKRSKRVGVNVSDDDLRSRREATTLDRVHAAMLLQAGGRANALRALLKAEVERGPDFLRLANALSALYPKDSEEKRLLDAMLLACPK